LSERFYRFLVKDASRLYPSSDRFARHFAAGKLGGDPVFRHLLESGLVPDRSRVLDIGCGQGLLAALLECARRRHAGGDWPRDWPAPPLLADFHGIDLRDRDIDRARRALGQGARFTCADMREAGFGEADAVVILDVLHYVDFAAQEDVLRRVREALRGGGVLVLRVGAKSGTLRFRYTEWVDRVVMRLRGHRLARLWPRPLDEWERLLASLGFAVEPRWMSAGTPFANVLLVSRLPAPRAAPA